MRKFLVLLLAISLAASPVWAATRLAGTTVTLNGNTQQLSALLIAASALPAANVCVGSVLLTSPSTNTNPVFIGTSALTGVGDAAAVLPTATSGVSLSGGGCVDLSSIYVKGTNSEKIHVAIL